MTDDPYLDGKNKQAVSDQSSVSFQSHNTLQSLYLLENSTPTGSPTLDFQCRLSLVRAQAV